MMATAMSEVFPRRAERGVPPGLDAAVLTRCRAQDPVAFRAFVVRYQNMVFALLSRMLGHSAEVEDLAQETFMRAYRAFPTFELDGAAKASTWLLTIATRLALDSRRKKKLPLLDLDETDVALVAVAPGTPEQSLQHRQLGLALSRVAAALPDDQRAALLLCEVHGLSITEIASALLVPENTAKTRLFRAREKMREALAEEWRTP